MTLTTPERCKAIAKQRVYVFPPTVGGQHHLAYTVQRCRRRAHPNGYCWQHQKLAAPCPRVRTGGWV